MKTCIDCEAEVDDSAFVCPKCGGGNLIQSLSGDDALAALDSYSEMAKSGKHVDRSAELYVAGRHDEAIAELKKALEIAPTNPTAHGNMGAILIAQGKHKEAVPWLEKALELNPGLEGVPAALAQAKADSEKKGGGGCFIATACYDDPDCPEVMALRRFRDQRLLGWRGGRMAVRLYYAASPTLAAWLVRRPRLKAWVRRSLLDRLVARIGRDGSR